MHETFLFSNKMSEKWICGKCQIARRAWFWHVASHRVLILVGFLKLPHVSICTELLKRSSENNIDTYSCTKNNV